MATGFYPHRAPHRDRSKTLGICGRDTNIHRAFFVASKLEETEQRVDFAK